jgi:8-oxo-dGTP pyrophosphatase MutT (NUDIX family)
MSYDSATPYIASYVIFEKDNKIAFLQRANTGWRDGFLSLPSGKVEVGETYLQAAVREAQEEVGVTVNPANMECVHVMYRHAEDSDTGWVDAFWRAKHWLGELTNAEPNKSSGLSWLSPEDLPENVVPGVAHALQQIVKGETFSEFGWDQQTAA